MSERKEREKWRAEQIGTYTVHKREMTIAEYCSAVVSPFYRRDEERQWYGDSPEALVSKLETGVKEWTESAEEIFEAILDKFMPDTDGAQGISTGVTGFSPNVPAYLAGRPDSMFCYEEEEGLGPMRIYISLICSSGISKEEMLWRGLAIAAYAYSMQTIRPVELYGVVSCDSNNRRAHHNCVTIPLGTTPINLSQLAVVLGHVGVGRRGLALGPKGAEEIFGGWQRVGAGKMLRLGPDDVYFQGLRLWDKPKSAEGARDFILQHVDAAGIRKQKQECN